MSKSSRKFLMPIISIMIVLLVIIGISFAYFTFRITGDEEVFLEVGTFDIYFDDGETIRLNNAVPVPDEVGMNMPGYSFTVRNRGTIAGIYQLSLEQEDINSNTLNQDHIRFSIREDNGTWSAPILLSELNNLLLIEEGVLAPEEERDYEIRLWLYENATNEAQGRTFQARLVMDAVQGNALLPDTTAPEIRLNGDSVINVEQHTPFVDPGVASVTDDRDILDIADVETRYYFFNGTEIVSVAEIDTSVLGVYYIYYTISDLSGNEGLAIRTINVYLPDRIPPVITLTGDDHLYVNQYEEFIDPGATAVDNIDGDITHRIVTIGIVNTNIIGNHTIKYIITDQAGNTASVSRVVTVVELIYVLPQRTVNCEATDPGCEQLWVPAEVCDFDWDNWEEVCEESYAPIGYYFWEQMAMFSPREIRFIQGTGSDMLRAEFDLNTSEWLEEGWITEEELEEYWQETLRNRFRRVKAPLSQGYVETFILYEDVLYEYGEYYWFGTTPVQYIQTRSGRVHTPEDSSYLFVNFYHHISLEKIVNLRNVNTSLTTNMSGMFSWLESHLLTEGLDLQSFDTSRVTDMSWMFAWTAHSISSLDVSSFDTSNVVDMSFMFGHPFMSGETIPLMMPLNWWEDIEFLTELDLSNFDTSRVRTMNSMFSSNYYLEELDISSFDTSNVVDMSWMFFANYNQKNLDLSHFDLSNVETMEGIFAMFGERDHYNGICATNLNLSNWDLFNLDFGVDDNDLFREYLFRQWEWSERPCIGQLELSDWNTYNVNDMSYLFKEIRISDEIILTGWDTSNVVDMAGMFSDTWVMNLDLSHFDTLQVRYMNEMFANTSLIDLDLSAWDTSFVVDMNHMFYGTRNLTNLNVSTLETPNVNDMSFMFANSGVSYLDLRNFNTAWLPVDKTRMFAGTTNLSEVLVTARIWGVIPIGAESMFTGSAINSVTFN